MSQFSVSMLEEAVEDVLIGKQFYEGNEEGVGAYFAASALADITSLGIYAGIHSVHFGYFRLYMKLSGIQIGLIFHFNVTKLKDGMKRYVL